MKFKYDPRIGQMAIVKEPRHTEAEVMVKVHRVFSREFAAKDFTPQEAEKIVERVLSGTRNSMYLVKEPSEWQRLKNLINFILRETN